MSYVNWKQLLAVFSFHNSKFKNKIIEWWKQSYGNRVIVCQTNFLLWVPPFLSYELWKQRIELSKNSIQTCSEYLQVKMVRKSLTSYYHRQVHKHLWIEGNYKNMLLIAAHATWYFDEFIRDLYEFDPGNEIFKWFNKVTLLLLLLISSSGFKIVGEVII